MIPMNLIPHTNIDKSNSNDDKLFKTKAIVFQ